MNANLPADFEGIDDLAQLAILVGPGQRHPHEGVHGGADPAGDWQGPEILSVDMLERLRGGERLLHSGEEAVRWRGYSRCEWKWEEGSATHQGLWFYAHQATQADEPIAGE